MQLEVDDKVTERATAGDIRRAVQAKPPHEHWSISLTRDQENWIEADVDTDDTYALTYVEGEAMYESRQTIDGRALADTLTRYLAGDERWRTEMEWALTQPKPTVAPVAGPGRWSLGPIIGVPLSLFVALYLIPMFLDWFGRLPWHRLPRPSWLDPTGAKIVVGFFAACVALVLVAVIVKTIEMRRARRWPSVMGRIVSSAPGFALTRVDNREMPRNERIANISYAFEVAGRTYQGKRVTLAEKTAESEVADLLARYPVGKIVTVFYDPADPSNAVLDREMPKGVLAGCLTLIGVAVVAVTAVIYLANAGPDLITSVFPNAIVPLVVIFGIGSLIMGLVAWGVLKGALAARRWPKVTGTVLLSRVQDFQMARDRSSKSTISYRRTRTAHMPVIEYGYQVAGKAFTSRSVQLDTEVGGSRDFAEKFAARYPVGKVVQVRHDPNDPSRAALEIRFGIGLFLVALFVLLLALAVWATGVLSDGPPLTRR